MFNNWQKDYQTYQRQVWIDELQSILRINKEAFEMRPFKSYKISANDECEIEQEEF